MKRLQVLSLLIPVFLCFVPLLVTAQENPLARVEQLYRDGQLDEAELLALRLLSKETNLASVDQAELHKTLAFISIAREDREAGMRQFIEALRLNPRLRLDRTLTSPKIYGVFERAQTDFEQMSRDERESVTDQLASYRLRVEAGRRSLLLPGLGQIHKGHKLRGGLLLGAAGVSVVGFMVSQSLVLRDEDAYHTAREPEEATKLWEEYRSSWRLRNTFGYAVGAVWIIGTLDAFLSPPPGKSETVISFVPAVLPSDARGLALTIRF